MKGSSSSHDLYARLGIPRDSSKHEIQHAFRQIALQEHPDKNPNNPKAMQTFQKAVEAYSILTDDLAREMYDVFGYESLDSYTYPFSTQTSYTTSTATSSEYYSNSSHYTQTTTYSNSNNNLSNIINPTDQFFSTNTSSSSSLPKSPINTDIKNEFSNSSSNSNRIYPPSNNTPSYTQHYSFTNVSFKIPSYTPKTQVINVNCSLNELYSGCTKQLRLSTNSKKVAFVEVEVPKGSANGTVLKTPTALKDLLDYDPTSIQFVVKEIPNKKYKRINNDLIYEVEINWIDALLGTEISIPTIDGKIINKHIEGLKSSNSVMVIPKCGMIYFNCERNSCEKGDMIVKFNIVFDNLNEEMKDVLKKFKI